MKNLLSPPYVLGNQMHSGNKKWGYSKRIVSPLRGGQQQAPMPSRALPETLIDRTFGLCTCWLCRERHIPKQDHEWVFEVLAQHVLGMPEVERCTWLHDWTARHGKLARAVLDRRIKKFTAMEER